MELIGRIFRAPEASFFLFGPRGTGKSTWLRRNEPDALYIDLLDPESFRTYLARPETLAEVVEGNPSKRTVASGVSPLKGSRPSNISYIMTPSA